MMFRLCLLFVLLLAGVHGWMEVQRASERNYNSRSVSNIPSSGMEILPDTFRRIYVDKSGHVSKTKLPNVEQIPIVGSPATSTRALYVAAKTIFGMVQFMPTEIYRTLASKAWVGIFTRAEKLTVYPQKSHLKNGNCGRSCAGDCHITCTFDGRKWEDVGGIGGIPALLDEDNVLCGIHDGSRHAENILIHEFAHTVHADALELPMRLQIRETFIEAKRNETWRIGSYAMMNALEYFAEATTVFFSVNRYNRLNTGGMNTCGTFFCSSEAEARANIKARDPKLFAILEKVFTDGHGEKQSNISTCPHGRGR